jgi:hypothetical protein
VKGSGTPSGTAFDKGRLREEGTPERAISRMVAERGAVEERYGKYTLDPADQLEAGIIAVHSASGAGYNWNILDTTWIGPAASRSIAALRSTRGY